MTGTQGTACRETQGNDPRGERDELSQAWTVAVKDVRVYYMTSPMIMFGLMMPFLGFSPSRCDERWRRHRVSPVCWQGWRLLA